MIQCRNELLLTMTPDENVSYKLCETGNFSFQNVMQVTGCREDQFDKDHFVWYLIPGMGTYFDLNLSAGSSIHLSYMS